MQNLLRRFKTIHCGEKGLTLIELVVVVAILGILAAIIVPNVASWIGEGKEEAARTELYDVQLAMTAVMAKAKVPTVVVQDPPGVADLTSYPTGVVADLDDDPLTPDESLSMEYYLIDPVSEDYTYAWDSRGKISQYEDGTLVNP
ncbi:type IV pilin protein [Chloroflexota bacterium]